MADHSGDSETLGLQFEERVARSSRKPGSCSASSDASSAVRVVCRLRPMNDREKKAGTVPAVTASAERKEVAVARKVGNRQVRSVFHFDDVLSSFSTQEDVFKSTLEPLISQVLAGFEATAFAYGQTGTGKTYTMEGELDCDEGRGLVPRAAAGVLSRLSQGGYSDYSIGVSYLEIYNEELSDLLVPAHLQACSPKLDLKDCGAGKGVCCIGLSEVPVTSLEDILQLITLAQERRRIAETRLNARSSRSHCIFTMKIRCRKDVSVGELENVGKLHLVDLAGSECAKKAGLVQEDGAKKSGAAEEERERRSINQSLLTLGRVIAALRDGSGRVPYRDSKLTRLLQEALGGKCKTVVIATLSPAMNAVEETISTLSYAEQATGITNKPAASSLLKANSSTFSPSKMEGGRHHGAQEWAEIELKNVYLTQELEEAQAALARQYHDLKRAEEAEHQLEIAKGELQDANDLVEEHRHEVSQLEKFSDEQGIVASNFVKAFGASSAHGQSLEQLLKKGATISASVRSQVREACKKAEESVEVVAASGEDALKTAAEMADRATTSHKEVHDVSLESSQSLQKVLETLVGAACKSSEDFKALVQAVTQSAQGILDEDSQSNDHFFDKINSVAAESDAVATKCVNDAGSDAQHGKQQVEEHAKASGADLDANKELVSSMSAALIQSIGKARKDMEDDGDKSFAQCKETIMDPLDKLSSKLIDCLRVSKEHGCTADEMKQSSTEDARTSSQQRQELIEALSSAAAQHSAAISSYPDSLTSVLQGLDDRLKEGDQATKQAFDQGKDGLQEARSLLNQVLQEGESNIKLHLQNADSELVSAWNQQRQKLNDVATLLEDAVKRQRDGNAFKTVQSAITDADAALKSSLTTSIQQLSQTRDEVAAEVEAMQKKRAAEEAIASLLQKQRDNLFAEVSCARKKLEQSKETLSATQSAIIELGEKQNTARAQAMEKIAKLVASEFASLGSELETANAAACSQLGAASADICSADKVVASAQSECEKVGDSIAAEASAWSEDVNARCLKITDVQKVAAQAAHCAEEAGTKVSADFGRLESLNKAWDAACEEVARKTDDAIAGTSELCTMEEALRPKWSESREHCAETAETWATGCKNVNENLCKVDGKLASASEDFGKFTADCFEHVSKASTHVSSWLKDGKAHEASLSDLSFKTSNADKDHSRVEANHQEVADTVCKQAADISDQWAASAKDASEIQTSCGSFAAEIPLRVKAAVSTLDSAESQTKSIAQKTEENFSCAAAALEDVCKTHLKAVETVCDGVRERSQEIHAWNSKCLSEVESRRESAAASASSTQALWSQLVEDASVVSSSLHACAGDTSEAASLECTQLEARLSALLKQCDEATSAARQTFEESTASTRASLSKLCTDMNNELADDPLLAFDEGKALSREAVPSWPADALRPEGLEVKPRPNREVLLSNFRNTRGLKVRDLKENSLLPQPGFRKNKGMDEIDSSQAGRIAFKQLNA